MISRRVPVWGNCTQSVRKQEARRGEPVDVLSSRRGRELASALAPLVLDWVEDRLRALPEAGRRAGVGPVPAAGPLVLLWLVRARVAAEPLPAWRIARELGISRSAARSCVNWLGAAGVLDELAAELAAVPAEGGAL